MQLFSLLQNYGNQWTASRTQKLSTDFNSLPAAEGLVKDIPSPPACPRVRIPLAQYHEVTVKQSTASETSLKRSKNQSKLVQTMGGRLPKQSLQLFSSDFGWQEDGGVVPQCAASHDVKGKD